MQVTSVSHSLDLELAEFLVEAKSNTYAALGDEASVAAALDGSKQLEYRRGAYFSRDVYFGMFRFAGQETVYRNTQPIWTMVYSGGAVGEVGDEEAKESFDFLREALRLVGKDRPFRGPSVYQKGRFSYFDESEETIRIF